MNKIKKENLLYRKAIPCSRLFLRKEKTREQAKEVLMLSDSYKSEEDIERELDFIYSAPLEILEDEYKSICNRLFITTDDGSYGEKGFVTNKLQSLIDEGNNYDLVIAIGPIPMMKFVSKVTEPYNIKTLVSLNPIMIDGTGMCGGCRVTVDGKIKFACVDGPDFDGHKVDYDELMKRNSTYRDFEAHDRENCRMYKAAENLGGAK